MERNMIVSTGDLHRDYQVIGPVYFQVSNKPEGFSPSSLSEYREIYEKEIAQLKESGKVEEVVDGSVRWECVFGEWCLGQSSFEIAFFIAVEELKKRAKMLGADGVIFMRQDIDLDKEAYQYFYLQMYGTAVKFR